MPTDRSKLRCLTVLFTCVGRRVELLQAFRAAAERLSIGLRLVGVDHDPSAPALACVDEPVLVPPVGEAAYLPTLLSVVRRTEADALIPTTDNDLLLISSARDELQAAGCQPLIADPQVIRICRDKLETYRFLRQAGIDTPRSYTAAEVQALRPPLPLFSKPLTGSASQRVNIIRDQLDLDYFLRRYDDLIIQEFVEGQEYTLDVYVGLDGVPRCVVPRARWQVRGGEVCKGVVVKDQAIMAAGKHVVETLGPSLRGLATLQCIKTSDGRVRFIEINPRFGGGAPLSIAAGADFPAWIMQELCGEQPAIAFDGFAHGMCMLRYDWSVFMPLGDDLRPRVERPTRAWPPFA